MKFKVALSAALVATAISSAPGFAAESINFGIISTESSANLKKAWEPMLIDMEKATGLKVNAFFAPDYAGVIEGMRFNKVQVAWFGNKSAMEAVDRSSGEIFAKTLATDGTEGYYSLLVVHKDSSLQSLDDVIRNRKDLMLGFGDPNSTSGTLVPGYYAFSQNKIDPTKDFKRTVRANHQTNLLAVASKQVDVATNNTDNWDRFEQTDPEKLANLRQIWKSPLIPSDPLVWRTDLDPKIKMRVKDFILSYGKDDREKGILKTIGFGGFKPSNNDQLITIRQLALVKDKLKIEGNTKMSMTDKAAELEKINSALNALTQKVSAQ